MSEMQSPAESRVENWIPHRGGMRLLDRILSVDEQQVVAEVDVPYDGMFVRDGAVPAWIGIEYMAQAVSAWAGGRGRRAGGQPRPGLLLGSRKYEAHCASFASGSLLRVEVQCDLVGANGLGTFSCRILQDEREVATARIAVFDPPAGADLLQGARA